MSDQFIQIVSSRLLNRRLSILDASNVSFTNSSGSSIGLQQTEWANMVEKYLSHTFYSLFVLVHIGNLCFGTATVIPLFFELELHLGKILDGNATCQPPLFWFTFLTLLWQYVMIFIFTLSFAKIVPKEVSIITNLYYKEVK